MPDPGAGLTLHHCPGTRSMRSLWLLHELGVPFTLRSYPFDKTLRAPQFLALSPAGRVPALECDGLVLFESGAIAQFLCEQFPDARLGRAPDHPERAAFLSWVHYAETLSVHCAMLTQQHVVIREDHQRSPFLMGLEAKRLEKALAAVEQHLAGQGSLLCSGLSAADIGVGQAVWMAQHFARLDPFVHLREWFAALNARPAFQASLPAPGEGLYERDFYAPWPVD